MSTIIHLKIGLVNNLYYYYFVSQYKLILIL